MPKCKNLFLLFILIFSAGLSFNLHAGPVCGDGVVDPGTEDCDPAPDGAPTSYCTGTTDLGYGLCKWTYCGDGVVQAPNGASYPPGFDEACDDGDGSNGPAGNGVWPAICSDLCQVNVAPTTTTTMVGPTTTTTTGATTTSTTTASTTTTAAATTTTTQVSSGGGSDDDLFDFGGGGCTIGNAQSTSMDPIWLFLLLAPGLGLLRRRAAATGSTRTKSV